MHHKFLPIGLAAALVAAVACTQTTSDAESSGEEALTLPNQCTQVSVNTLMGFQANTREDLLYIQRVGVGSSVPMTQDPTSRQWIIRSGGSMWTGDESIRLFHYEPECGFGRPITLTMCSPRPSDFSHYVQPGDSCIIGPQPARIGALGYVCPAAPPGRDGDGRICERGTEPLYSWTRQGRSFSPPFTGGHDIFTTFLTTNASTTQASFTNRTVVGCAPKNVTAEPSHIDPPL